MEQKGGIAIWVLAASVGIVFLFLFLSPPVPNSSGGEDGANTLIRENATNLSISSPSSLSIAAWNLQIFGRSKASNPELMEFYANKLDDYDIAIIQEIRDSSGTAFDSLCAMMDGYNCFVSQRAGTTSSKEQIGIFYKSVTLTDIHEDYSNSSYEKWNRPPLIADFKAGNWSFSIVTSHLDPDEVKTELFYLETVAQDILHDTIVIGDLNADCDYYDTPPADFLSWTWIIPDFADTTVSQTDCAYDRIILNNDSRFISYGIEKGINSDQSDHYLIWADFDVK